MVLLGCLFVGASHRRFSQALFPFAKQQPVDCSKPQSVTSQTTLVAAGQAPQQRACSCMSKRRQRMHAPNQALLRTNACATVWWYKVTDMHTSDSTVSCMHVAT